MPRFEPIDHDPFAGEQFLYMPIDHNPFEDLVADVNRPAPVDPYLASMSPVDAYKRVAEIRNARQYTPEEAAANRSQTLTDIGYITPIIGNLMSAADVPRYLGEAANAPSHAEGRKPMAMAALSALGAITGLPFGNIAKSATAGAKDSARIFAGPTAKTADHAALTKAQELTKSGASRDDVWNQTGWFQGNDGKWRFEISDHAATDISPMGLGLQSHSNTAARMLNHPELYKAYPEAANLRVQFLRDTPSGQPLGQYFPGKGYYARGKAKEDRRSVALHEGQHDVQHREGFNAGARVIPGSGSAAYNRASAAINEIIARNGGTLANASADDRAKIAVLRDFMKKADDYEVYRRTAGEVEARNVQTRINMSPAERRATPPWRTQDVPDDQQIIRFGGTQSDSAHNPITAKRVGEMKVDKGFIGNVEHELHIMEAGSPIAKIYGGLSDPQTFKIEWIQDMKGLGANTLGSEKIKQAMKAIKDIYPTVKWIAGERGMGARQGTSKAYETVRVPLR